ncbi:MAG: hypothetical protein ACRDRH_20285 [Pseudonocardia sp.]
MGLIRLAAFYADPARAIAAAHPDLAVQGGDDGVVDAAGPDGGVVQVDDDVPGGVEGGQGGAGGGGLPYSDLPR